MHLLKKDFIALGQQLAEAQQEIEAQQDYSNKQVKELLDEIQALEFQVRGRRGGEIGAATPALALAQQAMERLGGASGGAAAWTCP
jgi:di/tripeptidase